MTADFDGDMINYVEPPVDKKRVRQQFNNLSLCKKNARRRLLKKLRKPQILK
jgi:hypothetical protein